MRTGPRRGAQPPRPRARRARTWRLLAGAALAAGAAAPLAATSGPAGATGPPGPAVPSVAALAGAPRVVLTPGTPRLPPGDLRLGPLAAGEVLTAEVVLRLPDPAAVSAFVDAVATPGSPQYRHFLEKGQFDRRFGPPAATVAGVVHWLESAGIPERSIDAGGLTVKVRAPAAALSRAFSTPLVAVRTAGGRIARTNTAPPQVPAVLAAGVLGVLGLDTLPRLDTHLAGVRAPTGPGPTARAAPPTPPVPTAAPVAPASAAAPLAAPQACPQGSQGATSGDGYHTATQIAHAYGISTLNDQGRIGAGVTVGVYELQGFSASDIAAFDACYGISTDLSTVTVDGGPLAGQGNSYSAEAALDIENVAALAPGARIEVYEGPNNSHGPYDVYHQIATDDSAQVVTTSWGICEPQLATTTTAASKTAAQAEAQAEAQVFAQMAAQGQTIVAASGDSGAQDCYQSPYSPTPDNDTSLAVDDPAAQPDVLGAGGTTLPTTTSTAGQAVWNDCQGQATITCAKNGGGAGGGGISSFWPMPSYQSQTAGVVGPLSSGTPCGAASGTYCREVPDVAGDASPSTGWVILYEGRWTVVGGTSAVAPLWAALLADVEQGCAPRGGVAGLGRVAKALYTLGGAGRGFFDVTTGNNDLTGTSTTEFPAGSGYDMASGWGSPDAPALAAGLQPAGGCPAVTGLSAAAGPLSGAPAITVSGTSLAGASAVTFGAAGPGRILAATASQVTVVPPTVTAAQSVDVTVTTPNGTSAPVSVDRYSFFLPSGYYEVASDGGIFAFGDAGFYGSMGGRSLNQPVVGIAATPDGRGYYEVASDGGIFAFGDAGFHGSMGGLPLNQPIVGIAADPATGGYWEVAKDGGIFAFDAPFYGSMGGRPLNRPVVGIAATPDGKGYYEVASDGGIFAFGDAGFYGSMGGRPLNQPIVGIAATSDGRGYIEVASDGGIFAFGDAGFFGSMGGLPLNKPIVAIATFPATGGYWEVASDGGIFAFGAPFDGSMGGHPLNAPVVAAAT